jgi:hypothetical protein
LLYVEHTDRHLGCLASHNGYLLFLCWEKQDEDEGLQGLKVKLNIGAKQRRGDTREAL